MRLFGTAGMRENELAELRHDFKETLSCIDFSGYNPSDHRFLRALSVGLMYMAAKEICGEDDVTEELDGAEKYFMLYEQTGDPSYKEMASDELKHAGILIKKHLSSSTDAGHREWLNAQEKKRHEMMRMVSTATVSVKAE